MGENFWVYFRFLSAQKLTAPMIAATATAAMIATSVVMSGIGSGSIGPFDEDAGPTERAVAAASSRNFPRIKDLFTILNMPKTRHYTARSPILQPSLARYYYPRNGVLFQYACIQSNPVGEFYGMRLFFSLHRRDFESR